MHPQKEKAVFVMGPTGTGKSRLAIDLSIQFHGEIINSDKIQVYEGLPIVTNKVTEEECQGIPHQLLGIVNPQSDFTAIDFCNHALLAMESITERGRIPIIAGGSNSFIEALVNDHRFELKYECCFIWVDVSMHVLHSYVSKRVDSMVERGLVEELRDFYCPEADNSKGIRRAIGVSEMDEYLKIEALADEKTKRNFLETGIEKIKENTCKLASHQLRKIQRLNSIWGGKMNQIDATEVFLNQSEGAWDRHVLGPSTKIVDEFLYGDDPMAAILLADPATGSLTVTLVSDPVPLWLLPPIKIRICMTLGQCINERHLHRYHVHKITPIIAGGSTLKRRMTRKQYDLMYMISVWLPYGLEHSLLPDILAQFALLCIRLNAEASVETMCFLWDFFFSSNLCPVVRLLFLFE